MKVIEEISPLNKQSMQNILSIFGLIDRNIDQYDARERLQSFEDQKFYHNYNIHSAGMQDKLGY